MDDGLTVPHLWRMGFLAGMRLRMDAWRPLLDLNRVDHGADVADPALLPRSVSPMLGFSCRLSLYVSVGSSGGPTRSPAIPITQPNHLDGFT
jgi:hypothetical protein